MRDSTGDRSRQPLAANRWKEPTKPMVMRRFTHLTLGLENWSLWGPGLATRKPGFQIVQQAVSHRARPMLVALRLVTGSAPAGLSILWPPRLPAFSSRSVSMLWCNPGCYSSTRRWSRPFQPDIPKMLDGFQGFEIPVSCHRPRCGVRARTGTALSVGRIVGVEQTQAYYSYKQYGAFINLCSPAGLKPLISI